MGDGFYEAVVSTLMRAPLYAIGKELVSSENATVAEQEYLEIMFWLEEAGLPMTGANIARAMQLSPPTVHEMVGRLVDDGYVERNPTNRSPSPSPGASTPATSSAATG